MEPTKEQIKELWKRCGLHKHTLSEVDYTAEMPHWKCITCGEKFYPEGYHGKDTVPNPLELPIDLNNLWEYAEKPLVNHFIKTTPSEEECRKAYYAFLCKWLMDYIWNEPHDLAFALFWAIREVMNEKNKD